jgi:hypothetical protein
MIGAVSTELGGATGDLLIQRAFDQSVWRRSDVDKPTFQFPLAMNRTLDKKATSTVQTVLYRAVALRYVGHYSTEFNF